MGGFGGRLLFFPFPYFTISEGANYRPSFGFYISGWWSIGMDLRGGGWSWRGRFGGWRGKGGSD